MRYLKRLFFSILALFILLTAFISFLLNTTPGFYLLLQLADLQLPGKFEITKLEGSFLERGIFKEFNYIGEDFDLKLKNAQIIWQLTDLFHKKLTIKNLDAERVTVIIKKTNKNKIEKITVPLAIYIKEAKIKEFKLIKPKQTIALQNIETRAQLLKKQWTIDYFNFSYLLTQITLKGQLQPKAPFASNGEINLSGNNPLGFKSHIIFHGDENLYLLQGFGETLLPTKTTWEFNGQLRDRRISAKTKLRLVNRQSPITGIVNLDENRLNAEISLEKNTITISKPYNQIAWEVLFNIPQPGQLAPELQDVKTTITGKATIFNANKAEITLKIGPGNFQSKDEKAPLLSFNGIQITALVKNKKWELKGSIISEGRTLTLSGEGKRFPLYEGLVRIQGNNFPAMRTPEYTFNISPNLVLEIKANKLTLTGDVLVPSGRLKPNSFSNTNALSEDVVFINEDKKNPLPINLNANINLIMGNDVSLAIKGMQGFLEGSIQIKQIPYTDLSATGELSIRDGKYQAYGKNLNIEQGQLFFTGGAVNNPIIRLRATRTINTSSSEFSGSNQLFDFNVRNLQNLDYGAYVKVGIQISGRINSPKVSLFSIPSNLSQADILSLLLLGVPANQASKSGGQLLLTAISTMNLDSGTKGVQLLEQLKQSLGVDFNIQNTTAINQKTNQMQEGTAVVVSKALSKRLYLSYNIGLSQTDNNLLTLKYLLNKFFSLQVSTSDSGSGIDLLYTRGATTKE